jgi:predicted HAD superfamily Cof-like phosphohydrolase
MNNPNNDVRYFIHACEQKRTQENAELYANLIKEEYNEFIEALKANDDTEQLDACMDMIWVILGYCHMKKFDVDCAWDEVSRSNLTKIDPTTGKVIRREDGKILKPNGWIPPNLELFV